MSACAFPDCGRKCVSKGYCRGHYLQQHRGLDLKPLRHDITPQERFWSRVDKSSGCWIWTGTVKGNGYGQIRIDGRDLLAHRVSYSWQRGPVPEGMVLDHRCHQTLCVRPEHLRAVTYKQNQEHRLGATRASMSGLRGVSQHRSSWQARVQHHGKRYSVSGFSTPEDAAEAARLLRNELFTHNDLDRKTA